jgi:hypothetical protein
MCISHITNFIFNANITKYYFPYKMKLYLILVVFNSLKRHKCNIFFKNLKKACPLIKGNVSNNK